jgi:hypothetical protein
MIFIANERNNCESNSIPIVRRSCFKVGESGEMVRRTPMLNNGCWTGETRGKADQTMTSKDKPSNP